MGIWEFVAKKRWFRWLIALSSPVVLVFCVGLGWPESLVIPVRGASSADWNHETFWYYPWGRSVVHKGIDIFAPEGTDVLSATDGVVTYAGRSSVGGNVIVILAPKWRLHYYAHLKEIRAQAGDLVRQGQEIATVGTTGNAVGKPPHLHYSIGTLVPHPWRADCSRQGVLKMFILDPSTKLLNR